MKNILILCTGNSCRSQMAEGFMRKILGKTANVYSAGLEAHGVNWRAVTVMAELGIDIQDHTSNLVDQFQEISFDLVLTVCDNAKENCPIFPGATIHLHHSFPDPASVSGTEKEVMDAFRSVRDEIEAFIEANFAQS